MSKVSSYSVLVCAIYFYDGGDRRSRVSLQLGVSVECGAQREQDMKIRFKLTDYLVLCV